MDYKELNDKTRKTLKAIPELIRKNIVVAISILIVCAVLFIAYFNDIACHFYGVTFQANGQLLGTILTVIGGGAVIYGLYLNNKRIKEQNRQNNIADKTNNDKRFGDAIGYLNSNSKGVAIGGVYALYQLAKEDNRYVPIVANVFSKYLFVLDTKKVSDIIVDLVFRDIFKEVHLPFQHIDFQYITIKNTENNLFDSCTFTEVTFQNIEHFKFHNCTFRNSSFQSVSYLKFTKCSIYNCEVSNSESSLKDLEIIDGNSITSSKIYSKKQIDGLNLKGNTLNNDLYISSPIIKNSNIDASSMLNLAFNDRYDVHIDGNESRIKMGKFEDEIIFE